MRDSPQPVDVRVLYTEGCGVTPATITLVCSVAEEMGLRIRLQRVLVESPAQASELKFLGSPTLQVNGLDIDPAARSHTGYGFM